MPLVNGNGGSASFRIATVTLTDAQIKAIPTTFVQVAPASAGKALVFITAVLGPLVGTAYTYDPTARIYISYGSRVFAENSSYGAPLSTGLLDIAGESYELGALSSFNGLQTHAADLSNQPLTVGADNGAGRPDFGGGAPGNLLPVSIVYAEVPWT